MDYEPGGSISCSPGLSYITYPESNQPNPAYWYYDKLFTQENPALQQASLSSSSIGKLVLVNSIYVK